MDLVPIIFYTTLGIILFIFRKRLEWIGPIYGKMIRNVDFLRRLKNKKLFLKFFSISCIFLMIFFSIYSFYVIFEYFLRSLKREVKGPSVSLVIPGIKVPGSEFEVPFFEGLIAIFILAFCHEIAHALSAIYRDIEIEGIGFGFLLIFPVAFVKIKDEEKILKDPDNAIFISSSGPAMNFVIAMIFFLLFILVSKSFLNVSERFGVQIVGLEENAKKYGLKINEIILYVNGTRIRSIEDLRKFMEKIKPGDFVLIETNLGKKLVKTYNENGKAMIGIKVRDYIKPKNGKEFEFKVLSFLSSLFFWIYFLNFGVGLLNAYPLPLLDGGIFWSGVIRKLVKNEKVYNLAVSIFLCVTTTIFLLSVILPWML